LRSEISKIRQLGAELVVIGNGKPHHAKLFKEELELPFQLYVDPNLGTYNLLKMNRSVWYTIGPPSWITAWKAFRAGFRQKRTMGEPWIQGGVLVVTPSGQITYQYISKHAGDHPDYTDFMEVLRKSKQ
jgi:peroxiredoxin